MARPPAILLMGPTGAGKTDVAVALAERLPLEIVSVDAAMVFRGMDIGTAKPPTDVLVRAPHHLIDLIDPAESYSAARFVADAGAAAEDISSRGRRPLFVGGTMLYFRAWQAGLAKLPAADAGVRGRIEARAAAVGWPALHAELAARDPDAARRIRPGDRQRIQRALEVIELSGRPLSEQQREDLRGGAQAADLRMVLAPADRDWLYHRLALRFHDMMRRGLLEETRQLLARSGLDASTPSMRLIGYRQLRAHLEGRESLDSAVEKAVIATRQLARRQLTWLRKEPDAEWFDPSDRNTLRRIAERIEIWLHAR